MAIEITTTNRGFHKYGEPVADSYGGEFRVYESSNASGPHVWLAAKNFPANDGTPGPAAHLHLNVEQARTLIERLQCWLDEVPERWRREGESGDD